MNQNEPMSVIIEGIVFNLVRLGTTESKRSDFVRDLIAAIRSEERHITQNEMNRAIHFCEKDIFGGSVIYTMHDKLNEEMKAQLIKKGWIKKYDCDLKWREKMEAIAVEWRKEGEVKDGGIQAIIHLQHSEKLTQAIKEMTQ